MRRGRAHQVPAVNPRPRKSLTAWRRNQPRTPYSGFPRTSGRSTAAVRQSYLSPVAAAGRRRNVSTPKEMAARVKHLLESAGAGLFRYGDATQAPSLRPVASVWRRRDLLAIVVS